MLVSSYDITKLFFMMKRSLFGDVGQTTMNTYIWPRTPKHGPPYNILGGQ